VNSIFLLTLHDQKRQNGEPNGLEHSRLRFLDLPGDELVFGMSRGVMDGNKSDMSFSKDAYVPFRERLEKGRETGGMKNVEGERAALQGYHSPQNDGSHSPTLLGV